MNDSGSGQNPSINECIHVAKTVHEVEKTVSAKEIDKAQDKAQEVDIGGQLVEPSTNNNEGNGTQHMHRALLASTIPTLRTFYL